MHAHAHTHTHRLRDPGPHPRPPKPPLRTPCEPTGEEGPAGSFHFYLTCVRSLMGDRAAPPPRGGLGLRSRVGLAAAAGARRGHISIGIRLSPAPVWEGGGRRPHMGSGTARRLLGAGRTVSEDGRSFVRVDIVKSGGEEGRVCSSRRLGRVVRRSVGGGQWVLRRSVALGARRREAGAGWLSSGAHAGYICGTRTACEGGGAQLCMHVTRSLVRGRHTRPWSWPMALWFPHAAWGRGLTHGGRERSQRAVRGSSMAAVSVEEIRVLSWHAVSGPNARQ